MGSNFYWQDEAQPPEAARRHIGKRSGVCGGTTIFTWAIDPYLARRVCEARLDKPTVVREGGDVLTGGQFLRLVRTCARTDTTFIGQRFS